MHLLRAKSKPLKRIIRAITLGVLLTVLCASSVFAIADPDSPPTVNGVWVYNDLLEDGDCGVFIDYYLDYAVPPSETATEAYMGVFIDTDGVTQLKSVAPYTFVSSGYGRGIIWIYFSADEVTTYGIDSADEALYDIWLMGNPTLAWPGDPPRTIAGIDYWMPAGANASVLLALRVLSMADTLELAWVQDMIEETAVGSRLTTTGESYFAASIPNLRLMAPNCFSSAEYSSTLEDLDYYTYFGAVISEGTGTLPVSPLDLTVEGGAGNTVTITGTGTFVVELANSTTGTATSGVGGAVVAGSPVDLVEGTNTITVTLGGTNQFNITAEHADTQTVMEDTVIGTALDVTAAATEFGMSRLMMSGLIWLVVSIIICAAVYKINDRGTRGGVGSGKIVLLVFDVCIIGGTVLGMLHPLWAALLFIGFGALTGYVLFFRTASV